MTRDYIGYEKLDICACFNNAPKEDLNTKIFKLWDLVFVKGYCFIVGLNWVQLSVMENT